jgi:tol-pal system protein YbgF
VDATAVPTEPVPGAAAPGAAAPVAAAPAAAGGMQTAKPEEYEAYQKAYAKLKGQDFGGAIKAFNSFIATYPGSTLAGNAYYWLGKAYLQPPQDATKAQQAFTKVAGDFPQHTKAPDALYELGKISYSKGDKAKAKSQFQQVIDNYGMSGSTAPQLAKQFLDQNFK